MKLLPFDRFTLKSHLSAEEIKKRLQASIDGGPLSPGPFKGRITGDSFEISRVIHYRNSFLPMVKGRLLPGIDGRTEVKVTLKLWLPVLIFWCFWVGVVGIICLGIVVMLIVNAREWIKEGVSPMMFIPFGMLVFGYLLCLIPFKIESGEARKFLQDVTKAEIIP